MKIDLSRFRDTFFEEAADHLSTLEPALLRLEQEPRNPELLDAIFRAVHTIKGSSGTLGFEAIGSFTHVLESLLDRLRDGTCVANPEIINLLLRAADVLQGLLAAARGEAAIPAECEPTVRELQALLDAPSSDAPAHATIQPGTAAAQSVFRIVFRPGPDLLRHGLDPLLLLRELASMGEVIAVTADTSSLPPLDQIDPERCYLGWSLHLRTNADRVAIEDVFCFVRQECELLIESASPQVTVPGGPNRVADPTKSFANYLLSKELLRRDQVLAILDRQKALRPPSANLPSAKACSASTMSSTC